MVMGNNGRGPRKKTIRDKYRNVLIFHTPKGVKRGHKVNVIGRLDHISGMSLTDAQVRGLRDWLNWYLDNK